MTAHGEGYIKRFSDAGSIPAGSTKRKKHRKGASFFWCGANIEPVAQFRYVTHSLILCYVPHSPSAMRGHIPLAVYCVLRVNTFQSVLKPTTYRKFIAR